MYHSLDTLQDKCTKTMKQLENAIQELGEAQINLFGSRKKVTDSEKNLEILNIYYANI
jgi:hypothetical protein